MQDSTHLWETEKNKHTVKKLPERREKNNTHERDSRNGEAQRDVAKWHVALIFILGQLRSVGHAWTFSNDGNVLFMHLFIFKAESCRHRSAFNEKRMYLYLCMCMLCTASCVCSLYGCVCCMYVEVSEWMFWIKSKTLPSLSGQPKEECRQMKVEGCFCVLLLVCSVTLNVVWRIWKWHYSAPTSLYFLFWWVFIKPFGNFYLLLTQTNTHLFYAHQQWRNPKSNSLNNGHKETSSMHHQCRAFSHIAV